MALQLPSGFNTDIQGKHTALTPVIRFGNTDGNYTYISTISGITGNDIWHPLLLNMPSLKESVDIEKRNYKISSISIQISNTLYDGIRFSDTVLSRYDSFINTICKVFWISPKGHEIYANPAFESDRALEVYNGVVTKYEIGIDKISLTVEDNTQKSMHSNLPIANVGTQDVPDKDKNKAIPIVYGHGYKLPLVMKKGLNLDEYENLEQGYIKLIADSNPDIVIEKLYIHDGDYINIPNIVSQNAGRKIFETYKDGSKQWEIDGNYTNEISIYSGAEDSPISSNKLIGLDRRELTPATYERESQNDFLFQRRVQESYAFSEESYERGWYAGRCELKSNGKVELTGSLIYERSDKNDWQGESPFSNHDPDDLVNKELSWYQEIYGTYPPDNNKYENKIVGMVVDTNINGNYERKEGLLYLEGEIWAMNPVRLDNHSSVTPRIRFRWGGDLEEDASYDDHVIVFDNHQTDSFSRINGYTVNEAEQEILINNTDKLSIYLRIFYPAEFRSSMIAIKLKLNEMYLKNYGLVENMMEKDFFASAQGRKLNGNEINTIHHIIYDILTNELNVPATSLLDQASDESSGYLANWRHDFAITETLDSKKVIEQLASVTPYLPRFDYLGTFKLGKIPDNGGTASEIIDTSDVINFSFSRTEQVYSKIEFKYNKDYATGEFQNEINNRFGNNYFDTSDFEEVLTSGINGYKPEYYGLNADHSESTIVIDDERGNYIRDKKTAENFALWFLSWYCNKHLKFKVRLPLKYLFLEVTDIISFDDLLGDIKPYGIDYTKNSTVNGQTAYNTFIISSTNKTLDYVEIEAIQLHALFWDSLFEGVEGCTNQLACNYNPDANISTDCIYPKIMCLDQDGDGFGEYETAANVCNDNDVISGELPNNAVYESSGNFIDDCSDGCNGTVDCNFECEGGAEIRCGQCCYYNDNGFLVYKTLSGTEVACPTVGACEIPIHYSSSIDIASINIEISGATLNGVGGGALASYGFTSSSNEGEILAYTTGNVLPSDEVQILCYAQFSEEIDDGFKIEKVHASDPDGNLLSSDTGDIYIDGLHIIIGNPAIDCNSIGSGAFGDLNNNGITDIGDLAILATCVSLENCETELDFPCKADLNGDGDINILDQINLANCILSGTCGDENTEPDGIYGCTVEWGCTGGECCNYNPDATIDDGSCYGGQYVCPPNCELPLGTRVCDLSQCGCDQDDTEGSP